MPPCNKLGQTLLSQSFTACWSASAKSFGAEPVDASWQESQSISHSSGLETDVQRGVLKPSVWLYNPTFYCLTFAGEMVTSCGYLIDSRSAVSLFNEFHPRITHIIVAEFFSHLFMSSSLRLASCLGPGVRKVMRQYLLNEKLY